MKLIEYRALYTEGQEQFIKVRARDINSGFRKATAIALRGLPKGTAWEIARVEFWSVLS